MDGFCSKSWMRILGLVSIRGLTVEGGRRAEGGKCWDGMDSGEGFA